MGAHVATLLKADGTIQAIKPANGTTFSLAELQGLVGGYIEILNAPGGEFLVLNENGKRDTPTYNAAASELMRGRLLPGDCIVGDAILATFRELEAEDEGIE